MNCKILQFNIRKQARLQTMAKMLTGMYSKKKQGSILNNV